MLTASDTCKANETSLDWNTAGPAGATGATGAAGPTGPAGRDGQPGSAGCALPSQHVLGKITVHGVTGENSDGSMDVLGFSMGVGNSATIGSGTGGAGAGKATFQDLVVTKKIDKASPTLMLKTVTGANVADVQLAVYSSGTTNVLLTYKLSHAVLITSVKNDDAGRDCEVLTETVTFEFAQLEITHPASNTTIGWNVIENRAL